MTKLVGRLALASVLILLPLAARAQVAAPFAELARALDPNDYVIVVDNAGQERHGLVREVTPAALVISVPRETPDGARLFRTNESEPVRPADVREIWESDSAARKVRRLYGAAGSFLWTSGVKPGDTLIVIQSSGGRIKGRALSISSDSIVLAVEDASIQRTITPAGVQEIRKAGHLWDGVLKGAAIGGGLGLLVSSPYDCCVAQATGTGLWMGAAIGLGVDALWGPKRVYRAPRSEASLTVAPVLARGVSGARVSLSF